MHMGKKYLSALIRPEMKWEKKKSMCTFSAVLQMFFNKRYWSSLNFILICFCHLHAKSDRITMLDNTHLAFFAANAPWRQQTQEKQEGRGGKGRKCNYQRERYREMTGKEKMVIKKEKKMKKEGKERLISSHTLTQHMLASHETSLLYPNWLPHDSSRLVYE